MKNIIKKNNGQAMIEFIIVFPVLLLFLVSIMQFALLYTSKQILNYAAYNTARAAIVWIPKDVYPEIKLEKIKKAASITCSLISPNLNISSENSIDTDISKALSIINAKTKRKDMIQRYITSDMLITVNIFDSKGIPFPIYSPFNNEMTHTDITVELLYNCPLILPVIDRVLLPLLKKITLNNRTIYALPMKAVSTLPIEGNVQNINK